MLLGLYGLVCLLPGCVLILIGSSLIGVSNLSLLILVGSCLIGVANLSLLIYSNIHIVILVTMSVNKIFIFGPRHDKTCL